MFIRTSTIQYFIDHSDIKTLAVYLKLRKFYKKPVYYNLNYPELSKKTGVSVYLLKKHIQKLVQMDLAYWHGKHLFLKSFRKLRDFTSGTVHKDSILKVHRHDSIQTICNKLRFSILKKSSIGKQQYIISLHSELKYLELHPCSKGSFKRSKRITSELKSYGFTFGLTERVDEKIVVGYRKMAKELGFSIASVKKFLQKMKDWKYIKSYECLIEKTGLHSSAINFADFSTERGYFFAKGDYVYRCAGTRLYL